MAGNPLVFFSEGNYYEIGDVEETAEGQLHITIDERLIQSMPGQIYGILEFTINLPRLPVIPPEELVNEEVKHIRKY